VPLPGGEERCAVELRNPPTRKDSDHAPEKLQEHRDRQRRPDSANRLRTYKLWFAKTLQMDCLKQRELKGL